MNHTTCTRTGADPRAGGGGGGGWGRRPPPLAKKKIKSNNNIYKQMFIHRLNASLNIS